MKVLKSIPALLAISLLTTACEKEGITGNAEISGYVKHHDVRIPNAVVYIKYGAKELPGTTASDYDDKTVASWQDGSYEFLFLEKGNYYLYSVGYDSTISKTVSGGIPVKIKKKAEVSINNVPVTE